MPNDDKTAARRAQSRERSRRYRRRRKLGQIRISVDLPAAELDDALIDGGFLALERADDNDAVRAAAEMFARETLASRVTR
ncbi:hypothetical protein [Hyphomicrobium sp. DY-1]|uniref:hypothetical protein n=1 Tax=Hyphomicrobium sp. DY-1 TaxID=3075650 RepID=UPI0039C3C5E2